MSLSNRPISEQWRLAALHHVELEAAANLLEESKSTVLAQEKTKLGDMSDAKAERLVKSSPRWQEYIDQMCGAREVANKAKVEADAMKMRFWEQSSHEANMRKELGM